MYGIVIMNASSVINCLLVVKYRRGTTGGAEVTLVPPTPCVPVSVLRVYQGVSMSVNVR